jgi:hypothetical protein
MPVTFLLSEVAKLAYQTRHHRRDLLELTVVFPSVYIVCSDVPTLVGIPAELRHAYLGKSEHEPPWSMAPTVLRHIADAMQAVHPHLSQEQHPDQPVDCNNQNMGGWDDSPSFSSAGYFLGVHVLEIDEFQHVFLRERTRSVISADQ